MSRWRKGNSWFYQKTVADRGRAYGGLFAIRKARQERQPDLFSLPIAFLKEGTFYEGISDLGGVKVSVLGTLEYPFHRSDGPLHVEYIGLGVIFRAQDPHHLLGLVD